MGKRGKNVRKQRAKQRAEADEVSHSPHSIIYSLPGVGKFVRQLHHDLRHIFEPFTARDFVFRRNNRLKDVMAIAGRFHVSHVMYFTHTKPGGTSGSDAGSDVASLRSFSSNTSGGSDIVKTHLAGAHVNFHIVRVPEGPRLTFRVVEYSLRSDIQNLLATTMSLHGYTAHPPLVMCQGFTLPSLEPAQWKALSEEDQQVWKTKDRMLKVLAETLRNLVPALNVQKFKAEHLKRVLLISREEDPVGGDVIHWRHYRVTTQPKGVSRPVRKLVLAQTKGAGSGAGGTKAVPDLSHCRTVADYVNNSYGPDSEISDFDPATDNEVELEDLDTVKKVVKLPPSLSNLLKDTNSDAGSSITSTKLKHAVRLIELGPRMTIQLLKIEQGTDGGAVLYHRYIHRTTEEKLALEERVRAKQMARRKRREEQERRLTEKLKEKERKKSRKRARDKDDGGMEDEDEEAGDGDMQDEPRHKKRRQQQEDQQETKKKRVRFQPPKAALENTREHSDDDEEDGE